MSFVDRLKSAAAGVAAGAAGGPVGMVAGGVAGALAGGGAQGTADSVKAASDQLTQQAIAEQFQDTVTRTKVDAAKRKLQIAVDAAGQ